MKVLLDTHTFLWMAAEPEKLSARARAIRHALTAAAFPLVTRDPVFAAYGVETIW